MAAGLFLVASLDPHLFLEGFPVGNLGSADGHVHIKFTSDLFNGGLDVHKATAGEDGLVGLDLPSQLKGCVLLHDFSQGAVYLVLISLVL